VDLAFLLDSSAYHSYLDEVDRLRPGAIQVRAERLLLMLLVPSL